MEQNFHPLRTAEILGCTCRGAMTIIVLNLAGCTVQLDHFLMAQWTRKKTASFLTVCSLSLQMV